jgi:hypothetical protein
MGKALQRRDVNMPSFYTVASILLCMACAVLPASAAGKAVGKYSDSLCVSSKGGHVSHLISSTSCTTKGACTTRNITLPTVNTTAPVNLYSCVAPHAPTDAGRSALPQGIIPSAIPGATACYLLRECALPGKAVANARRGSGNIIVAAGAKNETSVAGQPGSAGRKLLAPSCWHGSSGWVETGSTWPGTFVRNLAWNHCGQTHCDNQNQYLGTAQGTDDGHGCSGGYYVYGTVDGWYNGYAWEDRNCMVQEGVGGNCDAYYHNTYPYDYVGWVMPSYFWLRRSGSSSWINVYTTSICMGNQFSGRPYNKLAPKLATKPWAELAAMSRISWS